MVVERIEERGYFLAYDDEGNEYTIYQYVEILNVSTMEDPGGEIEGLKSLRTAQGQAVNRLDKGQYMLVETDHTLYSDDEDAL